MDEVDGERAAGQYDSNNDAIMIRQDTLEIDPLDPNNRHWSTPVFEKYIIVHEVLHAVLQGGGKVEHGLVDAMEALHMGGNDDSNWTYGDSKDFSNDQAINGMDTHSVVGNAMYRIYQKIGDKDQVFRFALEVDKKKTTSLYGFRKALVDVARGFPEAFQRAVAAVLVDMGINDLSVNVVPISMLRFIAWKMRALATIVEEDDVAWVSAMAEEAERRIREKLGLDDNQMLRGR